MKEEVLFLLIHVRKFVLLWSNKNLHACQSSLLFLKSRDHSCSQFLVKWFLFLLSQGAKDTTYVSLRTISSSSEMAYSHSCHPDSSFPFFKCSSLLHTLGVSLSKYNCPLLLKCNVKNSFPHHSLYSCFLKIKSVLSSEGLLVVI